MYEINQAVNSISIDNKTFQDICTRSAFSIPYNSYFIIYKFNSRLVITDIFQSKKRKKREVASQVTQYIRVKTSRLNVF